MICWLQEWKRNPEKNRNSRREFRSICAVCQSPWSALDRLKLLFLLHITHPISSRAVRTRDCTSPIFHVIIHAHERFESITNTIETFLAPPWNRISHRISLFS